METSGVKPILKQPLQLLSNSLDLKSPVKQGFAGYFQNAVQSSEKLTISKHAQTRLDQRNITIDEATWAEIENKVTEAKKMGVTESLVVTDDAALVISAKNHTVITAMDRDEAFSQIFTNINGTILLNR
jgi:flagellar operon protein